MANKKHTRIRSKVERLVDILFSDVEMPIGNMDRIRAWLADPDKEEEKSDALYGKFDEIFKFNPEPVLAMQMWPDLARRLGMNETPVVAATDPLGLCAPVISAEPAPDRESTEARRRLSFGGMIARIAAVLVPILVVGGVALWLTGREESAMVEISVPLGETLTVELPDGSVIVAEPGAVIAYDESNFAANRLVSLSGEAMFDVAEVRDGNGVQIPFAVAAGSLTVNVLGTVFELSSGGEGVEAARVSLFEGSVGVTVENDHLAQAVAEHKLDTVLAVGERITVNTLTGEHATKLIPATEMALHGFVPLLKFDEATLGDLVTALEMNHGVKFNPAEGVDPTGGSYSGNFEGLSLDETLEMLSKIDVVLSFERSGDGRVDVKHK